MRAYISPMCGRYSITTPAEAMQRLLKSTGPLPNLPARYNVAPTQDVPVIQLDGRARRLSMMRWGLMPSRVRIAFQGCLRTAPWPGPCRRALRLGDAWPA
jgi:putative SOS response-associated peptidase YedK